MSKAVNILEVLEKAHQSPDKISERNKKVNRNLITDMGMILHGKDYTIHVSEKLSVKVDSNLVKEKLGEVEYHKCKVPTQYKTIQALPNEESTVKRNRKATIEEVADFRITA